MHVQHGVHLRWGTTPGNLQVSFNVSTENKEGKKFANIVSFMSSATTYLLNSGIVSFSGAAVDFPARAVQVSGRREQTRSQCLR